MPTSKKRQQSLANERTARDSKARSSPTTSCPGTSVQHLMKTLSPHPDPQHLQKCKEIEQIFIHGDSLNQTDWLDQILAVSGFSMHKLDTYDTNALSMSRLALSFFFPTFKIGWNNEDIKIKAKSICVYYPQVTPVTESFLAYLLCRKINWKSGKAFDKIDRALKATDPYTMEPCEFTACVYHHAGIFYWRCDENVDSSYCKNSAQWYFEKAAEHFHIITPNGGEHLKSLQLRNLLFLVRVKMKTPLSYNFKTMKHYTIKYSMISDWEKQNLKTNLDAIEQLASDTSIRTVSSLWTHFFDQIIYVNLVYLLKCYQSGFIYFTEVKQNLSQYRKDYKRYVELTSKRLRPNDKRVEFFHAFFEYIESLEFLHDILQKTQKQLASTEESSETSPESDVTIWRHQFLQC